MKFYCNEGLVPNVRRDKNNYRIFDERNIAWLNGLKCLRKCGLSIKDMKLYMNYCLEGPQTIQQRMQMLDDSKTSLLKKINEINDCINFIDKKQAYYNDVLNGVIPYTSNLIKTEEN